MLYYYAFTGHKHGLDRVKKAAVILNGLREKGVETMLLVNDFRAGLVAREFGVPESVTIETIQDIDAIAQTGDSVIIDSPEDDHGRLVKYCSDFKHVFRFAQTDDDKSIHGEIMLTIDCKEEEACISSIIVDDFYFEEHKKEDRTVFFLSDSDPDKIILDNSEFFTTTNMELILGNYFYVKYEDDLAKIFRKLHEAEEYMEVIATSKRVVTASFQTAIEASVAGAEVVFIDNNKISEKERELLLLFKIIFIISYDKDKYEQIIIDTVLQNSTNVVRSDTIVTKIIKCL